MVLHLFDVFLVGSPFENDQHQQTGNDRNEHELNDQVKCCERIQYQIEGEIEEVVKFVH